jgi:hypothetical protein
MFGLFFIGAGFSKPAALSLASELFHEVLAESKTGSLYENTVKRDINQFLEYSETVRNQSITEDMINLVEFILYKSHS